MTRTDSENYVRKLGVAYATGSVVDLAVETPRLLYFLDAVGIPEGLEFSPDGSRLFVGLTMRNHIAVYHVGGYQISNSQQVLRTGHHPTALAVSVFVE